MIDSNNTFGKLRNEFFIIFTSRAKLSFRYLFKKNKWRKFLFDKKFPSKKRINEHKPQRSRQSAFFSRNSVTMLQSAKTMDTMMHRLAGGTLSHNWKQERGAGDRFLLVTARPESDQSQVRLAMPPADSLHPRQAGKIRRPWTGQRVIFNDGDSGPIQRSNLHLPPLRGGETGNVRKWIFEHWLFPINLVHWHSIESYIRYLIFLI